MLRLINGRMYDIRSRAREHYEVYDCSGSFLFSADSYADIEKEISEMEAA